MKSLWKFSWVILAISTFLTSELNAQTQSSEDQVMIYLKDGSVLQGKILEWDYTSHLKAEINGLVVVFPKQEIDKVVNVDRGNIRTKKPITYKNEGLYYGVRIGVMLRTQSFRFNNKTGLNIDGSVGWQWNQYLYTGVGLAYRSLVLDSDEKAISPMIEIGGYIVNKPLRPFYNINIGYSQPLNTNSVTIIDSNGGMMYHPSIGLEFLKSKITLDIGYYFSKADYTYSPNFAEDRIERKIRYNRLTIRGGVKF